MTHEIAEQNVDGAQVAVVGIQQGGIHLAERLAELLGGIWGCTVPVGHLDVSMHRDDIGQRFVPDVHPTKMPFDVNGRTIILVDDVLYSGRTVRAALGSIHEMGRPERVQLAVLVDRGHRELPIKPDFVGKNIATSANERIDVRLKERGGRDEIYLQHQ